ncbi:MAG: hypothetical protein LBQ12_05615, partial [Deltaproteobacteria bacterium]|nr:hypothetical protein [Deltaproteobacteria bacterium]
MSLSVGAARLVLLLVASAGASCALALPYAASAAFTGVVWVKGLWLIAFSVLCCAAPAASVRASPSLRSSATAAVVFALAGCWAGFYFYLCLWKAMAAAFPSGEFPGLSPILGFLADPGMWRGLPLALDGILAFARRVCESGAWLWTRGPDAYPVRSQIAALF